MGVLSINVCQSSGQEEETKKYLLAADEVEVRYAWGEKEA